MFKTKRLTFKKLNDFDIFHRVYEDPVLTKIWPTDEITEDKIKLKFQNKLKHWEENNFGVFEIYLNSGDFIGLAGAEKEDDYIKLSGMSLSNFHGKFGLAIEALNGLLQHEFENGFTEEIIAYMYESNKIPNKLMKLFEADLYKNTTYKGKSSVYYKISKESFMKLNNKIINRFK